MEEDELAQAFNEAAEERTQEPISAASEYDPSGLDGTLLGNAPLPKQEFNQAANDPVDREFEAEQQNEVDHAPEPVLEPRPTPDFAPGVDRAAHNERQANLHQAEIEDFYDQAYDELESGQDGLENDNVNDGPENGGLDDGMAQD